MKELFIVMSEQVVQPISLKEPHTYFVGVFENLELAKSTAEEHSEYRDGKYTCIVAKTEPNKCYEMGLIPLRDYVYKFNSRIGIISLK